MFNDFSDSTPASLRAETWPTSFPASHVTDGDRKSTLCALLTKAPRHAALYGALALLMSTGCGSHSTPPQPTAATPEQIKDLVALLGSRQTDSGMGFDVRVAAASRLGEIGPPAKEYGAVPALEKLLNHKDRQVKEAAQRALGRIQGP